jgi:hypothetical protein
LINFASVRTTVSIIALTLVTACASEPYSPVEVSTSSFLRRAITQEQGAVRVTVAVPSAAEAKSLTGLDVYQQGIQPVWLKVENNGDQRVRVTPWSIDRNYFSPIEVAYMNRKKFSSQGYEDMQRWFYENRLERRVPPGESRSGFVYTHLMPGTKGFNLDLFTASGSLNFTFFVPMAGFTADYKRVDFDNLYADTGVRELAVGELQAVLEGELPCCSTDASGEQIGGPFNLVLVGSPKAVRRSLLRAGWNETAANDPSISDARLQHYRGRPPDTVFVQSREDSDGRLELRLWLAPWRGDDKGVWVGQAIFGNIKTRLFDMDSNFFVRFARENVAADVDSAASYVLQQFWYNQSLIKVGFVQGAGASTPENPHRSFTGAEYFTGGHLTVMLLSEEPVAMDETEFIYSRQQKEPGNGIEQ